MAEVDSVKYPSLPSNYVTIAQLQQRWRKEKQRKQQEEENEENKQYPLPQNHQNRIANGGGCQAPVGKNLYKRENHCAKGWREVGLVAKEPKLKEVKITGTVVEEGEKKKKKKGYFGKRKPRVERDMAKVSIIDVGEEEMSVENGGEKSSKGKCKWVEEVATVCMVEVVEESDVDRKKCGVGFRGKNNRGRRMGDRVGELSDKADREEQSGQERNAEKEKVRMGGAFRAYGDKEVEEVATVFTVEVVEEKKVDREIAGQKFRVGFRGKKHTGRKMVDRFREVSDKADSPEQSGQKHNAEKVRVSGAFNAYNDKEVEEVSAVCMVEVVEENKVDREIAGQKHRVGLRGKKHSWRKISDRVGELSDKANSVEQSGQEHNAEKEKVSVDVKERTNEKVSVDVKERTNEKMRVSGASCAYSDKEVEEVASVCTMEVVEENKVDREIAGQKSRVGFRGKKHTGRKMGDRVREVSYKEDSAEQSGQERNEEKDKVSVDVKERTNEKAREKGAFRAYSDKSKDVLIDSEAGLKMTTERDLGDLSLPDRRYGHGRSSVRVYGDKWIYGSSRRYEPRKMLKQRDNSFVWIKKGESSNGNAAEIETQVDFPAKAQVEVSCALSESS